MTNTSGGSSNVKLGSNVIMGGLIFQTLVFGVFIVVAMVFNMRFSRVAGSGEKSGVPWQSTLCMLYVTSWLVMIRNVFRVVEYTMGHDGYLLSVEWGVYVFDAGLMAITMAWFLWQYPNKLKPALNGDAFLQAKHSPGNSDEEMQQR